ncbi:MAG: helix-turn-helix domain-containing protein, partial [Candidatus Thiodiazotropha sp. 6PDIVS]
DFFLSMSRHEIGNYLGLAVETVSRLFTRFQDESLLRVERKHVQLLDIPRLYDIVQGSDSAKSTQSRV